MAGLNVNASIMLAVVVVSTICINLVLLNLLVSLITSAYESGEKVAHAKWRYRWATAILDMERLYGTVPVRDYFARRIGLRCAFCRSVPPPRM